MALSKKSGIGSGLRAWGERLQESHPELAKQLNEPRRLGFEHVEAVGLPHPHRFAADARDVLANPEKYFNQIITPSVFIFIQPESGLPTRRVGISKSDALEFLRETVAENPGIAMSIELSENLPAVYGGNILVKKDGAAMVEMKKGSQGELSAGTVAPEYRAWQDTYTGQWRYSFEDIRLREMIQEVMRELPHDEHTYLSGLYEFNMVQGASGRLEPWFVDYRPSDAFTK